MSIIFRSSAQAATSTPAAVVVHCSDPRFQPHFQEFLHTGLSLPRYALVAIPGGPQLLSAEFAPSGWQWLKFLVDLTRSERLILITHSDCRWYFSQTGLDDESRVHECQLADLRQVGQEVAQRFSTVKVEPYHAVLEGDRVLFESIPVAEETLPHSGAAAGGAANLNSRG